MGTDYYLADPIAKEVRYIDRSGRDFVYAAMLNHQTVAEWPHGPVRVVTKVCQRAVADDLTEGVADPSCLGPKPLTQAALAWCAGRELVLLIDDSSALDYLSHDFCFRVLHGEGVPGWSGSE